MCLKSCTLARQVYFVYMAGDFFFRYLSPVCVCYCEYCDCNGDRGGGLTVHRVFHAGPGLFVPTGGWLVATALLAVSTFPQCLPCLHLDIKVIEHPALSCFKTLLQEVPIIAAGSDYFFIEKVVDVDLVHF